MKQLEKEKEELLIQLEEEKKTSSHLLGDLYELLASWEEGEGNSKTQHV